jgi:hypothetical protein
MAVSRLFSRDADASMYASMSMQRQRSSEDMVKSTPLLAFAWAMPAVRACAPLRPFLMFFNPAI